MTSRINLITLVSLLCSSYLHSQDENRIKQQYTPVTIDGNLNDWQTPLEFYNKESGLAYSLSNDSSNLYFCLLIADKPMQMKIMRAGMTIGLDTGNSRKPLHLINYPIQTTVLTDHTAIKQRPDMEDIKDSFKKSQNIMNLSGFKSENGPAPLSASNSVAVCMDWNKNDDLVYEARIPIASFWKETLTHEDASKLLSLHIRVPALERPSFGRPNRDGRPSGGRPGGRGRPSWTQNGNSEGFQLMLKEQKVRHKFYMVFVN